MKYAQGIFNVVTLTAIVSMLLSSWYMGYNRGYNAGLASQVDALELSNSRMANKTRCMEYREYDSK